MEVDFQVEPQEAGMRLGPFLRRRGVSLSLVRSLKWQPRGLLVNGLRAHTNAALRAGDAVALTLPPDGHFSVPPSASPLHIVYEDEHVMVVNKPAGQLMHPSPSRRENTLAAAFGAEMMRRGQVAAFRPVGRLDADTSGLVLCALNTYAVPGLSASMQKQYLALAAGRLPRQQGVIEAPLAAAEGSAILQEVSKQGRPSRTEYEVLCSSGAASLVLVTPRTGRTHQIRAHFAHLGHPLLGDSLYGGPAGLLQRQALHCARLRFRAPGNGTERCFVSPLPEDMEKALAQLEMRCPQEQGTPAGPAGPS